MSKNYYLQKIRPNDENVNNYLLFSFNFLSLVHSLRTQEYLDSQF